MGQRQRASRSVAVAALVVAVVGCRGKESVEPTTRPGHAVAERIRGALDRAEALPRPIACAAGTEQPAPLAVTELAGRELSVSGRSLRITEPDDTAVLGVVANAGDATEETIARLRTTTARFAAAKVEVVIVLGGFGGNRERLTTALEALRGDWLLLVLPGNREPVEELRAVIAALGEQNQAIADGSQYRLLSVDGVELGTLPGSDNASRVAAGSRGCVHTPADAARLAQQLSARDGVRVVASYAAPRQSGRGGSDVTTEGIHSGSDTVSSAMTGAKASLSLSAEIPEASASTAATGTHQLTEGPLYLAAGAAEQLPAFEHPAPALALVVRISATKIEWQYLTPEGS